MPCLKKLTIHDLTGYTLLIQFLDRHQNTLQLVSPNYAVVYAGPWKDAFGGVRNMRTASNARWNCEGGYKLCIQVCGKIHRALEEKSENL